MLVRNVHQQERARALFAKYGLSLETPEFQMIIATSPVQERVAKPIRMRIHRSCHLCQSSFGPDRTCKSCDHKRCKKCPRYPNKGAKEDGGPKRKEAMTEPRNRHEKERRRQEPLTIVRDGKTTIRTPVMQRIRRKCHKCQTEFVHANQIECGQCGHTRCTRCPREPSKKEKWIAGYPGDAQPESSEDENEKEERAPKVQRIYKKPRQRVRWNCEHCQTMYMGGRALCGGCGHVKCDTCPRNPYVILTKGFQAEF